MLRENKALWLTALTVFGLVWVLAPQFAPSDVGRPDSEPKEQRIDSLLAVLDHADAPVTPQKIAPYSATLDALVENCRLPRRAIGDMAAGARELIQKNFGKSVQVKTILDELVLASSGPDRIDCASGLALLIVLTGQEP